MRIYHITETKPSILVWKYAVVAETQDEALLMVQNGEVEPVNHYDEEDPFEGSMYSVDSDEEVEDKK
jgi:hypothetical protein